MPILLDHQLREQIPHKAAEFPVVYYHDELAELPNWTGPIHWHPDLEIATAAKNVLDYQVGQQHIIGKDKLLYRAIKADKLGSLIFYGPPGTGKTTEGAGCALGKNDRNVKRSKSCVLLFY